MNKKLQFKSLLVLVALLLGGANYAWGEEPEIIWSEDFTGLKANDVPTAPTNTSYTGVTYTCVDGKGKNPGITKVMNEKLATGASAPELMIGKKGSGDGAAGGSFTAVIPLDGIEGTLTLTYYQNKQTLKVYSTTDKVSGGQTLKPTKEGQQTTTFTGITKDMTSITIVFEATTTSNVRLDDIVLTGNKASSIATPVFDPTEGTFTSGQNVTLSCATEGATIYYTMGDNPADPTSESTAYTKAIAVNATTTIKAIAINGSNASQVASATYTILPVIHAGTQEDPYTVADARNAIDAGNGLEKVYVKGIVCTGGSSLANGTMSYWISDDGTENNKLEAYKGKNLDNTNFAATTDVKVNDVVVIYGNLKKYNTTYEFDQGNYIVSLEQSKTPVINANNVTIECNATSGEIDYEISNPTTGTALTADITEGDWISNLSVSANKVTFTATANTGGQRTAKITLSYTGATDKEVTITQKKLDYATVPFTFDGNSDAIANTFGLTGIELGNYSSSPKLKFDSIKDSLILKINEAANVLTFDVKGNPPTSDPWEGTFEVKTSSDGNNYTTLASYTKLASTVQHESLILGSDVRYILWVYSTKTAGNVALGNIKVFNGEVITIPESKYTTFASTNNIDFEGTGVTVCIAKVENGAAQLAAITGNIVPANTGVILYAEEAGNYAGTIIESTDVSITDNDMVGVTTETAVPWTSGSKYNYILQGGVFKKATGDKLKAGKAYLSTDYQAASRELKIVVEGEATAIKAVETVADKNVYDLQGRKVAAPTKGLYIINGKKMIVK